MSRHSAILLMQTLSQLEMWREAPGAPCGVATGRSCLCTGGTATETCRLAATTTLGRASTCSSLTTPTPCFATRLSTSTSTTLAEGRGDQAGGVCWLSRLPDGASHFWQARARGWAWGSWPSCPAWHAWPLTPRSFARSSASAGGGVVPLFCGPWLTLFLLQIPAKSLYEGAHQAKA